MKIQKIALIALASVCFLAGTLGRPSFLEGQPSTIRRSSVAGITSGASSVTTISMADYATGSIVNAAQTTTSIKFRAAWNGIILTGAGTEFLALNGGNWHMASTVLLVWGSGALGSSNDSSICRSAAGIIGFGGATCASAGAINITGVAFASLGTPANGTIRYCTDCDATCAAGSSSGKICARINGAWAGL